MRKTPTPMRHPTRDDFRLYIRTRDHDGREHEEGPYGFGTARLALLWLAGQRHVMVLHAWLWHKDELIAEADSRKLVVA